MSSPSSPDASRLRLPSSLASRATAAAATSAALARGMTTTPSSSATITSPGLTSAPAHTTAIFTEPMVAFTVPLAEMALGQTGKPILRRTPTSRQPASMISPRAPRAWNDVASKSPNMPSSLSALSATTTTSPGLICSAATCSIQLSPGWASTVTALPQHAAPG